jgi:hypothetical protein
MFSSDEEEDKIQTINVKIPPLKKHESKKNL